MIVSASQQSDTENPTQEAGVGQQWLWEVTVTACHRGMFQKETVSEKHQGTLARKFPGHLRITLSFLLGLTLTYSSSCNHGLLIFTFAVRSGEPAFMNSSQLLSISDAFLGALAFRIFLVVNLSLLIPPWSSPPGFQVIVIAVIRVIAALCAEENSQVRYSIKAKLDYLEKL